MKQLGVVLLFLSALFVRAQNDMHANVNLQFRFVNPGARAQAMGGSFIGVADDTTAIFANPAGLTRMSSNTLVLEGNTTRRDNNIPFYAGRIDQVGLQDFDFNLESRDFPKSTTNIPFLAYVHTPGRVKWGVFLAEQANFERPFNTEGVGIPPPPVAEGINRFISSNQLEFFPPSQNDIELKLRSLGVSVGGKLSERVSVGATLSFNDFTYHGTTTLFIPNIEALFPEFNFSPSQLAVLRPLYGMPFTFVNVDGDDQQIGVFAGLLFAPTDRFYAGVSYKRQPKFDYDYQIDGLDGDLQPLPTVTGVGSFDVPDNLGLGFSFQPVDVMILSVEVDRIFYSDLVDDFITFFDNDDDPSQITQTIGDTTEYHLGFEYFFTQLKFPLALRAGYWYEPFHALQNTSLDTQILFRFLNQNEDYVQGSRQTVFLQRFEKDQNHLTFGLGFSFGRNLTLDFAGDVAEETQSFSFSGIYRF